VHYDKLYLFKRYDYIEIKFQPKEKAIIKNDKTPKFE